MTAQAWGTTVLRVTIGVIYVMHGYYAVAVLGPAAMTRYISGIGYPAPLAPALAWYGIIAHLVGGALIIIGLWTRWAALANVPVMASAVLLVHLNQGFFMRATDGGVAGGYEYSLLVLTSTIALVLLGAGAASVDGARR